MTRSIVRKLIPSTDPRLGRHVHHDSESRRYPFDTAGLSVVSAKHTRRIPVLQQGDLGSCTGNAGVGCLGTDPYYDTVAAAGLQWHGEPGHGAFELGHAQSKRYSFDEAGAVALYSDATKLDDIAGQYPPQDTGSSGLAVAKALKAAGEIAGYQHTFSLDDALKALGTTPVICGTVWYQSMFTPGSDGQLTVDPASGIAGGHEYVLDEVDADRQRVWLTNSWGDSWGAAGRAWMTFDDLGGLLDQQGDVTVFTPLTQPAPTPVPAPPVDPVLTELAAIIRNVITNVEAWLHKHGL